MLVSSFLKHVWLTVKYGYLLYKLKIEPDEIVIVSNAGIGDLYLKLILLEAIKEKFETKKISIGIHKPAHSNVLTLFKNSIYKVYTLKRYEEFTLTYFSEPLKRGQATNPYRIRMPLFRAIGYKDIHYLDVMRLLLSLQLNSTINLPIIPKEAFDSSLSIISDHRLRLNKTVIISPHAVYFKDLEASFWLSLADRFYELGFSVVLMTEKFKSENLEIKNLFFPLDQAIPFINSCGFFVGYRSGFCDLVSSTSARKVIIYPYKEEYTSKHFDIFEGFSLEKMGLTDGAGLLEIMITKDNDDYQYPVEEIIKFIHE